MQPGPVSAICFLPLFVEDMDSLMEFLESLQVECDSMLDDTEASESTITMVVVCRGRMGASVVRL